MHPRHVSSRCTGSPHLQLEPVKRRDHGGRKRNHQADRDNDCKLDQQSCSPIRTNPVAAWQRRRGSGRIDAVRHSCKAPTLAVDDGSARGSRSSWRHWLWRRAIFPTACHLSRNNRRRLYVYSDWNRFSQLNDHNFNNRQSHSSIGRYPIVPRVGLREIHFAAPIPLQPGPSELQKTFIFVRFLEPGYQARSLPNLGFRAPTSFRVRTLVLAILSDERSRLRAGNSIGI